MELSTYEYLPIIIAMEELEMEPKSYCQLSELLVVRRQ
jgi:hypothetical protein